MTTLERGGSTTRRTAVKSLVLGGMAAVAAPYIRRAVAAEPLYVNTWGGIWEKAAQANLFDPFSKDTGTEIKTVSPVSFAKLAAQVRSGVYEFDVTTLGGADIIRANEAGLIEAVDPSIIDEKALFKGAVFQNGVASHAFATVIAYRKDKYPNGGPQNWKDFWDLAKFPGSRCLQRHASRALAFALLADGVPLDKLYPFDIDRAFKSFERIKPAMRVWWTQGQQSQQLLRDGEVDCIGIWHGRTLELLAQNQAVELVWNQSQIDRAYWVVAKGSPRAKRGWEFIRSAVRPERLAGFCLQSTNGPLNPKAFYYLKEEDAKTMPTYAANYAQAFEQDVLSIAPKINDITKRFEQWIGA